MEKIIPEFLVKKIKNQYNNEEADLILDGLKKDKKTTFRVNRLKSNVQEIEKILNDNNIKFEKIDFYDDAFILDENSEELIRKLDIYKEGKIYLQSLSSMIPVIVLEPKEKENILDICAAPRRKNNTNCKFYK